MTFEHYYAERVSKLKPLSPLWQGNGAITEEMRAAYEAGRASRDVEREMTEDDKKPTGTIGHVDDGKQNLTAAVMKYFGRPSAGTPSFANVDFAKESGRTVYQCKVHGISERPCDCYTALNKGEG